VVQYFSWALMGITATQMWLAGNGNRAAWFLGIGSQSVWLFFDYLVGAYGLMPLAVILSFIYIRNLRKWKPTAIIAVEE
jgi:hypothetical protein